MFTIVARAFLIFLAVMASIAGWTIFSNMITDPSDFEVILGFTGFFVIIAGWFVFLANVGKWAYTKFNTQDGSNE